FSTLGFATSTRCSVTASSSADAIGASSVFSLLFGDSGLTSSIIWPPVGGFIGAILATFGESKARRLLGKVLLLWTPEDAVRGSLVRLDESDAFLLTPPCFFSCSAAGLTFGAKPSKLCVFLLL